MSGISDDHLSPDEVSGDTGLGDGLLVVGIGASAGGVAALKEFFTKVPRDSGATYVVVPHLSPDHESHLAEVLQSTSTIPVTQIRDRTKVEPNFAYVVSPRHSLTMQDGYAAVSEMISVEERRAPIDIFFRTLAQSHQTRAVCVVLSGSGADGSMGLKRVKECGGICVAQDPEEAEHSDMPRSAIATGFVDMVLPVAEIPARILGYRQHRASMEVSEETRTRLQSDDHVLRDIFAQLRVRTGHDFANYKRSTVLRRIQRRISVHGLADMAAYAAYVRDHPDEARSLLKDLLISVTNFFRDCGPFRTLEEKFIPRMFENKGPHDHVRVWVPGCATGEEAYSIAMLLSEYAPDPMSGPDLQVFATDIDETALAKARSGFYTLNDAADVSSDRLRRFFVREEDGYRVRREIREMVLFASHNVIKDPPFSHLDLVSCRNLLIYLNRVAQQRVLEVFHFALRPGGYLFLGNSEVAESENNLFISVDKANHIFQSRPVEARLPPPIPAGTSSPPANQSAPGERSPQNRVRERLSYYDLHQRMLEQFAPPSIIVNEEFDILHVSGTAGQYLHVAGGEPSSNLLKMIKPELRLELRTALYQALQNKSNVEARGLQVEIDGRTAEINLMVRPILREDDAAHGLILVLFDEKTPATDQPTPVEPVLRSPEPIARHLEDELIRAKGQLRATVEQHELQQEELKASNEELQAMNEELRSSAEELETSKEELQSVNEELTTVNQELKIKVEELSQSNSDFRNLITSTEIATVFLDRALRIKLFTPRASDIFNVIAADVGRPLADITSKLVKCNLVADAEDVIERLQTIEREVDAANGRRYLMRLLPYRTPDDRIDGVVITFMDISVRWRAETALQRAHEELEQRVQERTRDLVESNAQLQGEIAERKSAQEARLGLLQRLVSAQEDERRRISRELHDEMGQLLAGLIMELQSLEQALSGDKRVHERLQEAQLIAEKISREIHDVALQLRPTALDDLGLHAALPQYVDTWSRRSGVEAEFHAAGTFHTRLPQPVETVIYRIVQEALTNVAKHAEASRVNVFLDRQDRQVVAIVEDDGKAFDADEVLRTTHMHQQLGLIGMRERLTTVGGTLVIESSSGNGTTIIARIPVTPP